MTDEGVISLIHSRSVPEPNTGCWLWIGPARVVAGILAGTLWKDGTVV